MIHPSAIVSTSAHAGQGVRIGPFAVIEDDVVIGENSEIGPHAVVARYTMVGRNCRLYANSVVGCIPQDLKFAGERSTAKIGNGSTIREFVTISRGTKVIGVTEIGEHCLIMAYCHIAHDCRIGNHVILSNAVNMGGHVQIGDHAVIGGMVPIHQFVRVGAHSMIGGGFRVSQDVPPFVLAAGSPLRFHGLNLVGLRRRGFDEDLIARIDRAYRLIYRSSYRRGDALSVLEKEDVGIPEIRQIVEFFGNSERGVIG